MAPIFAQQPTADDMTQQARMLLASQSDRLPAPAPIAAPVFANPQMPDDAQAYPNEGGPGEMVMNAIHSLFTLPQRAIQNSQQSLDSGNYDPSVPVEAALTTMGGGLGGAEMKAGETALGAGPIRSTALDMSQEARMARAADQGYTIDAYHGTNSDFPAFNRVDGGNARGAGTYVTTSPETASRYATGDVNRITPDGNAYPNVMPLKVRSERPFDEHSVLNKSQIDEIEKAAIALGEPWKKGELAKTFDRSYPSKGYNVLQTLSYNPDLQNKILKRVGYDSRMGGGIGTPEKDIVVFDPTNIRSRFASFDPANKGSNLLMGGLAGAVAAPIFAGRDDKQ